MIFPCPKPPRQPKRPPKPRTRSVRSKKSGGHLFPANVSLSRRAFIRRQRCIATGVRTGEWVTAQPWMPPSLKARCPYKARVVAAHVKPGRGAAGKDESNMLPLEWMVHDWMGQIGQPAFVKRLHLVPLGELAQHFEGRYQAANANATRRGVPVSHPQEPNR
jgi:hypothetical protein